MCPPIRTACHSHLVSFPSNPPVEPYIALQRRRDDYWHEKIYAATDRVRCRFLDHDPPFAEDILHPPTSGAQFHHAVVMRERRAKDRAIAKERREKDETIAKERREKDEAIAKKDEAKKKAKRRKNKKKQLTAWMKGNGIEFPAELQDSSDDSSGRSRSSTASPERQRLKI